MNPWDEWKQHRLAKLSVNQKRKDPKNPNETIPKRLITEAELEKIKLLKRISPAHGCGDMRFIRQLENATLETLITERQAWFWERMGRDD